MDLCGIPSKANWYLHVIIGRDGETSYTDMYVCDEHMPAALDEGQDIGSEHVVTYTPLDKAWDEYKLAARKLFRFDGHEAWDVLEIEVSRCR